MGEDVRERLERAEAEVQGLRAELSDSEARRAKLRDAVVKLKSETIRTVEMMVAERDKARRGWREAETRATALEHYRDEAESRLQLLQQSWQTTLESLQEDLNTIRAKQRGDVDRLQAKVEAQAGTASVLGRLEALECGLAGVRDEGVACRGSVEGLRTELAEQTKRCGRVVDGWSQLCGALGALGAGIASQAPFLRGSVPHPTSMPSVTGEQQQLSGNKKGGSSFGAGGEPAPDKMGAGACTATCLQNVDTNQSATVSLDTLPDVRQDQATCGTIGDTPVISSLQHNTPHFTEANCIDRSAVLHASNQPNSSSPIPGDQTTSTPLVDCAGAREQELYRASDGAGYNGQACIVDSGKPSKEASKGVDVAKEQCWGAGVRDVGEFGLGCPLSPGSGDRIKDADGQEPYCQESTGTAVVAQVGNTNRRAIATDQRSLHPAALVGTPGIAVEESTCGVVSEGGGAMDQQRRSIGVKRKQRSLATAACGKAPKLDARPPVPDPSPDAEQGSSKAMCSQPSQSKTTGPTQPTSRPAECLLSSQGRPRLEDVLGHVPPMSTDLSLNTCVVGDSQKGAALMPAVGLLLRGNKPHMGPKDADSQVWKLSCRQESADRPHCGKLEARCPGNSHMVPNAAPTICKTCIGGTSPGNRHASGAKAARIQSPAWNVDIIHEQMNRLKEGGAIQEVAAWCQEAVLTAGCPVACITSGIVSVVRGLAPPQPITDTLSVDDAWMCGWCSPKSSSLTLFHNVLACAKSIDISRNKADEGCRHGILEPLLHQLQDVLLKSGISGTCTATELWTLSCFASHVCRSLGAQERWWILLFDLLMSRTQLDTVVLQQLLVMASSWPQMLAKNKTQATAPSSEAILEDLQGTVQGLLLWLCGEVIRRRSTTTAVGGSQVRLADGAARMTFHVGVHHAWWDSGGSLQWGSVDGLILQRAGSQMELLSARAARLVGWAIGDGGHDNAALESSALLKTVRRVLPAAVQWLGWNWGHEVVIQDLLKRLKRASRPGAIVALRIMSTIIQTMARATQQDPSAKAACMSVCKALLGSGAAGQTARTVGVKQEIVQLVAGVLSTLAYVQKEVAGSGGESVLLADADLGECLKLLQAVARKLHPSSVPRSVMPMMAIGREGVNKQRKSEGRK